MLRSQHHVIQPIAAAACLLGLALPVTSHGMVTFSFQEVGSGVQGTVQGSLDLTGASDDGLSTGGPTGAAISTSGTGADPLAIHVVASNPASSQSLAKAWFLDVPASAPVLTGASAVSKTGSLFSSNTIFELAHIASQPGSGFLYLDANYVGGTSLNRLVIFPNTNLASLHIQPGSYVYTLSGTNQTITLSFTAAAVPEPQTVLMLLLGLGVVTSAANSRRRAAKPAV